MMRYALAAALLLAPTAQAGHVTVSHVSCDRNHGDEWPTDYLMRVHVEDGKEGGKIGLGIKTEDFGFAHSNEGFLADFNGLEDEDNLICNEWDGRFTVYNRHNFNDFHNEVFHNAADANGEAKFRIPVDECDDDTNLMFFTTVNSDYDEEGLCRTSGEPQMVMGVFVGAAFVMKLPRYEGDVDATLAQAIAEWTYHTLIDDEEHGMYRADDIWVQFDDCFYPLDQATYWMADRDNEYCSDSDVFVYIGVPTLNYEGAIAHLRHGRREFGHDDTQEGHGRRSNDNASHSVEKELERRIKAHGKNPSMGAVELLDSQIWRDVCNDMIGQCYPSAK